MPHEKGTHQCPTTQCPIRRPNPRRSRNRRIHPAQTRFRPRALIPAPSGRNDLRGPHRRNPPEIPRPPRIRRRAKVPERIVVGGDLAAGAIAAVLPVHVLMAMSHLSLSRRQGLLTCRRTLRPRQRTHVRMVRLRRHLPVRRSVIAVPRRPWPRQVPAPGRVKTALQGSHGRELEMVLAAGEVVGAAGTVRAVVRAADRTPSPRRVDRTPRVALRSSASHSRADETVLPSPNVLSRRFSVAGARSSTRRRSSDARVGSAMAVRSAATS